MEVVPFHKWIFAHKIRRRFIGAVDKGRPDINIPYEPRKNSFASIIKPVIAFFDNYLLYINSQPDGRRISITIFDRFICATQIKFKALNYQVDWFRPLWQTISTDLGFIIDVPVEISLERQIQRGDPYTYTLEQLSIERVEYLHYAEKHGFPVVKGQNSLEENVIMIFERIKPFLPAI